jgi:hypothetical protein
MMKNIFCSFIRQQNKVLNCFLFFVIEHKAGSEFVCLDKDLDVIAGGSAKHLGKLFYLAEAVCGALTCPPYQNGKEITCAVCSK